MIVLGVIMGICGAFLLVFGIYVLVTSIHMTTGKKNAYQVVAILFAIAIVSIGVALYCFNPSIFAGFVDVGGGDGITTCGNCGRKASLNELTGYCSRCNESFWDWVDKNYD